MKCQSQVPHTLLNLALSRFLAYQRNYLCGAFVCHLHDCSLVNVDHVRAVSTHLGTLGYFCHMVVMRRSFSKIFWDSLNPKSTIL